MSKIEKPEAFPKPRRQDGKEPCGECRIQPGETCDICGAKGPAYDTRAIEHPPYNHPGDVA